LQEEIYWELNTVILGTVYGVLFWAATLMLVLGIANKVRIYWNTPAPLKIPTMPAPVTQSGVVWRMFREVVFFHSLFRSSKATWLFAFIFHMGMWLVFIRHARYFQDPVWDIVLFMQPFGKYAGFLMALGLAGLLVRRFVVDRVRYISAPSDYLMLVLFLGIVGTGLMTSFVVNTDVVQVKEFFRGLMMFNWQPLPSDPIILIHLALVAFLMLIFPISKLLHAPGVFFSPTRNQVDNPREQRHISPWAKNMEDQGKMYLDE